MKKVFLLSIICGLIFVGLASNVQAQKKPTVYKGQVVALEDVIKSVKDLQLTKERAKELYESASPLVFLYNKKIYFVLTDGGAFASKKLCDYAHNKKVAITGTTKTVSGINYIIMNEINKFE